MFLDAIKANLENMSKASYSGGILCQNTISCDSFQAICAWVVLSGNYNYVLCFGGEQKYSGSVVCR